MEYVDVRPSISRIDEKDFINILKEENFMSFNYLDNINIYLFFATMGMMDPLDVPSKTGFIQLQGKTDIQAKVSIFLLGTNVTEFGLDTNSDLKKCVEYADMCSYSGYKKFSKIYDEYRGNEDNLMKLIEIQLNTLYDTLFN